MRHAFLALIDEAYRPYPCNPNITLLGLKSSLSLGLVTLIYPFFAAIEPRVG